MSQKIATVHYTSQQLIRNRYIMPHSSNVRHKHYQANTSHCLVTTRTI